jgi:NDP-sugar pyrophosphorylase family protein
MSYRVLFPLLALLTVAQNNEAQATDRKTRCTIAAGKDDLVTRDKDIVVESRSTARDVTAINGNVTVRGGAKVKNAIAFNGSVTVEPGAHVSGSVIAVGGKLNVSSQAQIDGSQIALDHGFKLVSEDGDKIDLALSVDGNSVLAALISSILESVRDCQISSR